MDKQSDKEMIAKHVWTNILSPSVLLSLCAPLPVTWCAANTNNVQAFSNSARLCFSLGEMHHAFVTVREVYNHHPQCHVYIKEIQRFVFVLQQNDHKRENLRQKIFTLLLSSNGLDSTWLQWNLDKGNECMCLRASVFSLSFFKLCLFKHLCVYCAA